AQYQCPLCEQVLSFDERTFRCENNHCFDLAKENYVNLLPVQFKHSKEPGDNKAMVNARRAFLEKRYYQPLINKLVGIYQSYGLQSGKLFDAGCGEGYYTHQHKTIENSVYGIDIAKEAVKKAAKKYPQCHFSVGTLSQLPFENNFFDWIISIYAPILETEFSRVLNTQGYLLTVTPAQRHLIELKEKIYREAKEHNVEKSPVEQLTLIHQENLSYEMTLDTGEDVLNLLSMTPFAFKASETVKQELAMLKNFICHADFQIRLYQK
ncbi:MAG: 23S rRNA (guanine(745)-N(1))-methyltransferase, partial [Thalassotalea sp.]|nr:23S rRNA (guanine(745)-N(1))-methyltransferase [Thalassotalea sp.]